MQDESLKEIIESLGPKILILGKEFENSSDPNIVNSIKLQISNKREIEFHGGEINYGNSDLLHNSKSELQEIRKRDFLDKCKKEAITNETIFEAIKFWKNSHLLVIGDTIVDQYAACEPLGISAEAPVVVVKELEKKNFIGGSNSCQTY